MNRSTVWTWTKIFLAAILLIIVVWQVNPDQLLNLWRKLDLLWLIPSVLLFYLTIVVMARRSWQLIEPRIPFHQMLGLVIMQTAISNLVATSAGIASYVAILRGRHQVRLHQGIASVLLAKFGDLSALLIILAISSALVWSQIGLLQPMLLLLLLIIFCVVAGIASVVIARSHAFILLHRITQLFRLERFTRVQRIMTSIQALTEQEPRHLSQVFSMLFGYSSLLLAIQFAFAYCNMQLFTVPVDMPQIAFILSLNTLIAFIPIQVFGGLGVFEISGLYIFGLFVSDQAYLAAFLIGARIYSYALNALLLPYLFFESRFESLDTVASQSGDHVG